MRLPDDDYAKRMAEQMGEDRPTPRRPRPKLIRLSDVTPRPEEWLWHERFPIGKLSMLVGDPGLGKSFVTLDMAARVTTGRAFPDAPGVPVPVGGVVLISAEDDPETTIVPRLDALGADTARMVILDGVEIPDAETGGTFERGFTLEDLPMLEEAIEAVGACRLVIVDPVAAYFGGRVDSHRDADVRGVLRPLSDLARRYRVALVVVAHLNKGQGKAIYRASGSLGIIAAARMAWGVARHPDDDDQRVVFPLKSNLAESGAGMAYQLHAPDGGEIPVVQWDARPVYIEAETLLASPTPETSTALEDAIEWLETILADGPVLVTQIQKAVKKQDFSMKTVRRAKKALQVVSLPPTREIRGWRWALPDEPDGQPCGTDLAMWPGGDGEGAAQASPMFEEETSSRAMIEVDSNVKGGRS